MVEWLFAGESSRPSEELMTKKESARRPAAIRLLSVFVGSALSVFGLLILTMAELEDFSASAFKYWGPRAVGVVLATTLLGIFVSKWSVKGRFAFGVIAGLLIASIYLLVTN